MRSKSRIIFTIILILNGIQLLAQYGYYATDSSISRGRIIVDGGPKENAKFCRVKLNQRIIAFSPYEINEYGLGNGKIYVANKIRGNDSLYKVFLERLILGKTNLYYFKDHDRTLFFIEKETGKLIELSNSYRKSDTNYYTTILSNSVSDCALVENVAKKVTYNKSSIKKFVKTYNSCSARYFPFLKYGILIGYEAEKLIPSSSMPIENIKEIVYTYNGSLTGGFFIDIPILASDFSLQTEIYYSSHGKVYNYRDTNKDIDIIIKNRSINIPISLRYTYPSNKVRPFIDVGGLYSFQTKNENTIYETSFSRRIIEIAKNNDITIVSDHEWGYMYGAGLQFDINQKNSIFLEIRNYQKTGITKPSKNFKKNSIQITSGINF